MVLYFHFFSGRLDCTVKFGETFSGSFTEEFIITSQSKKKKSKKSTTLIVLFKEGEKKLLFLIRYARDK